MKNEGFYFNTKEWKLYVNPLCITNSVRVPTPLVLVIAPLLGGLFVVYLPFLGFWLIFKLGYQSLIKRSKKWISHFIMKYYEHYS